jgi:kynureninase
MKADPRANAAARGRHGDFPMTTLQDCRALDGQDPLRELRGLFTLPEGVIYLDGNSLGVLPRATPARVAQAITQEWGQGLIALNSAGWFSMPQRLGDKIAPLIGAKPARSATTAPRSISILSAALRAGRSETNVVVSERSNFRLTLDAESCARSAVTLRLGDQEGIKRPWMTAWPC